MLHPRDAVFINRGEKTPIFSKWEMNRHFNYGATKTVLQLTRRQNAAPQKREEEYAGFWTLYRIPNPERLGK
jgi:hypothetical protein